MKKEYRLYTEILRNDFLARHNISERPSNHHFHIHPQLEILLPCSDGLKCQLEHQTVSVPKHHLFLLNHSDLHRFYMDEPGRYDRYVFYFSPEIITEFSSPSANLLDCFYLRRGSCPNLLPLPEEQLPEFLFLADRMVYYDTVSPAEVYGAEIYKKIYLIQFLLKVNRQYLDYHQIGPLTSGERAGKELVYQVLDYIHLHYQDTLTMDQLSARFLISKTGLHNAFRMVTGDSPGNSILHFRLSKAKALLLQGCSVELAGQLCGFGNLSHFSRIFKRNCGMSPKQFQLQARTAVSKTVQ